MKNSRREFLGAAGALAVLPLLGAQDAGKVLVPTEDNIEGPYYRKDAPFRGQLAEGIKGDPLSISGRVYSADGRQLTGADVLLDVWHASALGEYDNDSDKFLFRGRMRPGRCGRYRVATVMPGQYDLGEAKRPAHIHFKISAPGHRPLTTQLYFKGDPWLERDPFVRKSLIIDLQKSVGAFDIVLAKA
jgi:catechol 1,2-dioxygenase